ncbi:hypothetical protein ACFL2D_02065 [Patescibacteria group bacterium]
MRKAQNTRGTQTANIGRIVMRNNIVEMTNEQLFGFLQSLQEEGDISPNCGFTFTNQMTVAPHLDVWFNAKKGIVHEASESYVRYTRTKLADGTRRQNHSGIVTAWMLKSRETFLRAVTSFILLHQRDFFQEDGGKLKPISLTDAAELIIRDQHWYFLDEKLDNSAMTRIVKNKIMSINDQEYLMREFFTTRMYHPQEIRLAMTKILKAHPGLSDMAMVEELEGYGIGIARRTVTKYRAGLGIKATFSNMARRRPRRTK